MSPMSTNPNTNPRRAGEGLREQIARVLFERGRGAHDAKSWETSGSEMQEWLLGHADALLALLPVSRPLEEGSGKIEETARDHAQSNCAAERTATESSAAPDAEPRGGDSAACIHCGGDLETGPWGFTDCPACNPNPARG